MSHDNKEWRKVWRKTNMLFQKWQEFDDFLPEHAKFSKFPIWLVPFVQSIEELSFMTLKTDAKFERKLTCCLKKNVWKSTWNLKIVTLMGSFYPK